MTYTVTVSALGQIEVFEFETEATARKFARQAKEKALTRGITLTARVQQADSLPTFEGAMGAILGK